MKRSGVDCGPLKDCGNPNPLAMCETDGQGNCSEWIQGDMGIMEKFDALSADDFHLAMEASTTRFFGKENKDGNLVLEHVGMLKAAGLVKGDVLTGVVEVVKGETSTYTMESHQEKILSWPFESGLLNIKFKRAGLSHSASMKNPAGK